MSEEFKPQKVRKSVWLFHFRTNGKETAYVYSCVNCRQEILEENFEDDFCPYCKTLGIPMPFLRCYYDTAPGGQYGDFIRPMLLVELQIFILALLRVN